MYQKLKVWVAVGILTLASCGPILLKPVQAASCPDLRVVFARGSGGERWNDQNYLEFKSTIETKLQTVNLDYEFIDLDYPAVSVGVDNLGVALGAIISGGEAYEFGDSVKVGVDNLTAMINGSSCPQTKYVIGGYSQGAMVVSKALNGLKSERIIYAATFGDPKIYLPEGEGMLPAACRGDNLSNYRMYVPDCRAYKGLLGAYIPYQPETYIDKLGTWCNKKDVFCSSYYNITNHINYVNDGLYEDASRVIFNQITDYFGLENHVSSPHDTAILIDSTGSMASMIDKFKSEALRLARETLENGGRVALYDYRDLNDPYEAKKHCNFETCTLEIFENELSNIEVSGGGDDFESLLSSSLTMMKELNWKLGATKSLVVLTDAGFLSPDRDGVTLGEVVALSKEIDPVNFYIITNYSSAGYYTELANATGGKVVTNFDELSLLTDYILQHNDTLPSVEENDEILTRPHLEIVSSKFLSEAEVSINIETDSEKVIVVLNDKVLGETSETEIIISGLQGNENRIALVPVSGELRGESVVVEFNEAFGFGLVEESGIKIPKTPNTGRL